MATTKGTLSPITPCAKGGTVASGSQLLSIPIAAAQTVRVGDILTLAAGVATRTDTAHADAVILGVAMSPKATIASPDFTDQVLVAPAYPGALFFGHLVAGAGTDYTANTAAIIAPNTMYDTVLCTDAYAPFIVINTADTTGGGATNIAQTRVINYAVEQLGGKNFTAFGNTVIINPRVMFAFRTSVFQPLV